MSPDRYRQIAKLVASTWNTLAKENGWPKRVTHEAIGQMRPLITATDKGLNRIGECTRNEETLIRWVMSRWNWQKSPAPITQVGMPKLWETLKDTIDRESEETAQQIDQQLEEVAAWAKFRFDQSLKSGISKTQAIERVESYAIASGKIDGWNHRERIKFQETLEGLNSNPS